MHNSQKFLISQALLRPEQTRRWKSRGSGKFPENPINRGDWDKWDGWKISSLTNSYGWVLEVIYTVM